MRALKRRRGGFGRTRKRRWVRRPAILSCSDGTTAIEFAVILPAFLVLVLGIAEFGRLMWTQAALQFAAEGAARCYSIGSTCNSASTTQTYAAQQVFGMTVASSAFTATEGAGTSCGGYEVQVSGYTFTFIVPKLFPWTITLKAQSCHP